ncbi:DUF6468 domain-containing protein [Parapedomonas caeni]|jgi:hypothetical protein
MIGWIVDVVLCLLLLATLVGGWRLNQRLLGLRRDRVEMDALIKSLNATVGKAESSIHILRAAAQEAETTLADRVAAARSLVDELTIITETGERLANRIEHGLTGGVAARPAAAPLPVAEPAPKLHALKGVR